MKYTNSNYWQSLHFSVQTVQTAQECSNKFKIFCLVSTVGGDSLCLKYDVFLFGCY